MKTEMRFVRAIIQIVLIGILVFSFAAAQQTTFQDQLLDSLAGSWLLQGTIAGMETTHIISAKWVLGHQYLQIYEISQEKNANGGAAYEAIVYIGWDQPGDQYACLWLDVTGGGGLSAQAIGHAKRNKDEIPFVFKSSDGSLFHNTFVYNRSSNSWQWMMDNEENGKLQPFARVKLTKK